MINFFKQNFFGKHLAFEYRIYMIFFLESYFISILSATTNTALGKGFAGVVLQWTYILLCTIILFIPQKIRFQIAKPILVFICLIYIPFLFFQTAGYDGTALQFSLLGIFILCIIFKGKMRWVLVILNIVISIGVCVIQFKYPELIIPHGTEQAKLIDVAVALALSSAGMAILTIFVSNAYEIERERIAAMAQELKDISNRDALTGAYNRRYLSTYLERELAIVERKKANLCVLMLDLDHFKKINDTYGHGFGDEVLVKFTELIQSNLRKYDVLVRLGGEEFLVALSGVDTESAYETAVRIKNAVSDYEFYNGVHVTVSIGLTKAKEDDTIDTLIDRADLNLYKAKDSGRNMVIGDTD